LLISQKGGTLKLGNLERGSKKTVMQATSPPKDIGIAGISISDLLEKTLASLDEAILVIAPATRAIVSCNKVAEEIFGYPREEIIGRNTEFLHLDHERYEQFGKELFPALNASGVFHKEYMMRRRDGSVFPTDHTVTEIRDTAGNRVAVVSAVRDITDRMTAEREIQLQRDNFLRILNAITDGIYIVNRDCDIEYVNPVIEREFGKVEGRKCHTYFHDRAEPCPWCKNEEVFNGKSVRWEWSSPKTGKSYDLLDAPITNPDGSVSKFEIFHDITERKRMEDALGESEERYRSLFENSHSVMLVIAPDDGAIVDANPSAVAYYGWTRDELQRKNISDINTLTPEQVKAEIELARTEKRNHFIFKHRRAHGEPRDVEVYSGPIKAHGRNLLYSIVFDITERKRAEDALRESEFRHSLTIASAALGTWYWNIKTGSVIFNERWAEMRGYRLDEIQPHVSEWEKGIHPDDLPGLRETLTEHFESRTTVFKAEYRVHTKLGKWIWILDHGTALERDADGNPMLMAGIEMDITERKQSEELLARSEAKYRALTDQSADGIFIFDQKARFLDANPAAEKLSGYSLDEMRAMSITDLIAPEDLQANPIKFAEIMTGKTVTSERELRRKDGSLFPAEITSKLMPDGNILGTAHDITERKRAEDTLRQSEERFRNYFDFGQVGMAITSLDQKWLRVNDRLCEILGYTKDELTRMTWTELTHPDDLEPDLAQFRRLLAGEIERYEMDKRFFHKNGNIVYAHITVACQRKADKSVEYFIASVADITERKVAEMALAQSERDYRTVANFTNDWETWREPDGRFRYVSPSCERITGYPPERFVSDPDFLPSIIHAQDIETYNTHIATSHNLATSGNGKDHKPDRVIFRITRKDGEVRWIEHVCQRVYDEKGEWLGTRGSNRDITELIAARELAESATKLKDQFVSLVAHDLRSPFTSMMGLLRLFADRKSFIANAEDQKALDTVFNSGDRMLTMIEELLKISRLQTGKITPQPRFFKGRTAVAVTIGSISHTAAQKGVVIINEVPEDMRLYADQSLFDEVLLNLLTNAIKFCSSGDRITFFVQPGLKSAIAIRDTGKGVDERIIPNLFKHEVKTTTVGTAGERGTGLGLPYSYDIIKAHGGEITVESAPGKGTVFCVMLPYVRPIALVVDDEPMALLIVRSHLERIGIEVTEAVSGERALSAIKERRPHIVITDLSMPVMDGFDLLDRLKKDGATRDIPVIMMTSADGAARDKAFRHGADDFVKKPIEAEDFVPRVRRFVG
jgi:PAS domain S-box-containing protein